jgi:hypothetical protein
VISRLSFYFRGREAYSKLDLLEKCPWAVQFYLLGEPGFFWIFDNTGVLDHLYKGFSGCIPCQAG